MAVSTLIVAGVAACDDDGARRDGEDTAVDSGQDTPGDEDLAEEDLADSVADSSDGEEDDGADAVSDVMEPPTTIETACTGTLTQNTTRGERVVIDLCPYLGDPASESGARLFKIEDAADILEGVAAQGRVGDYLIDTGKARFVVHGPDRRSTPCPHGGTLVDASYLTEEGTWTPDHVGEICLFFQLGRTIAPEADDFEILRDGSDGGAVVLAVTSPDVLNDWINLRGMVEQYIGTSIRLPLDADQDFGLTLTQYFIARPGQSHVEIVTAVRNDGDQRQSILLGDLIDSGGVVSFFNPENLIAGFGYEEITPEPMSFLAFVSDESSHAYVPRVRGFSPEGRVEVDASYLAVSGVAVPMLGTRDLLSSLLAPNFNRGEGVVLLNRGFWHTWERSVFVGSADVGTLTDAVYAQREQPSGVVSGRVVDADGQPVAGVPVAVLRYSGIVGRGETRFLTDAEGRFSGRVPVGADIEFVADPSDRAIITPLPHQSVAADQELTLDDIVVSRRGAIEVTVENALDGSPIPAKVTVLCNGPCPRRYESQLRDITRDALGAEVAAVEHVGVDGQLTINVPPGDYRVVVSRGMAWSVWPVGEPGDGPVAAAAAVTVPDDGSSVSVEAQLFPAVDRAGFMGADFHVHAVNSPDAPVDNFDRVRAFLAAGVDVLISSDHDYVTDFAPYVRALGAEGVAATMVGVELTTFDYGHYNAFPLVVDESDLTGGAPDWAVHNGPSMHPSQVFAALSAYPDEQILQLNHPYAVGMGYLRAIEADIARRISRRDPTDFRMLPVEPGADGDTGLYVEDFTALELLNGYSLSGFWTVANAWFAMLANGFTPTATASSDTHRLYSDISGDPRTWVEVGAQHDTVATFDAQAFVRATNAQKAFGTTGPFVRVRASSAGGTPVGLGGTVSSGGEPLRFEVEVQTPLWMHAEQIAVFGNVLDSSPAAGMVNSARPEPIAVQALAWDPMTDLVEMTPAGGGEPVAVAWRKTVAVEVMPPAHDTFYMVVVETPTEAQRSMFPVIWDRNAPTFAYTNPIYVDVDGNGQYDAPGAVPAPTGTGGSVVPEAPRPATLEDFERLRELLAHEH